MVTATPTQQMPTEHMPDEHMPTEQIPTEQIPTEQMPTEQWTVGELAADLGITTRTLRFYEDRGLISPARRGAARSYDHRDRAQMRLILRGKRFGMSLAEIAEIVGMYDGAATSERRQLETLLARLNEITDDLRARQQDLAGTLAEVSQVASQCHDRLTELSLTRPDQSTTNEDSPVTQHSHR